MRDVIPKASWRGRVGDVYWGDMFDSRRGFTLIELLVVIAIIGILSAVVLASLNSARSKGSDAGVKANLHTVETQANIFLNDNNSSYGVYDDGAGGPAACPAPGTVASPTTIFHDPTVEGAIAAALKDSVGGTATCFSDETHYSVAVSRPLGDGFTPPSSYWCVDNTQHCGVNSNALSGISCGTCDSDN